MKKADVEELRRRARDVARARGRIDEVRAKRDPALIKSINRAGQKADRRLDAEKVNTRDNRWEVTVSNIGTVYSGSSAREALRTYNEYVVLSERGVGRAGGETVTRVCDDVVEDEHYGSNDEEGRDQAHARRYREWYLSEDEE